MVWKPVNGSRQTGDGNCKLYVSINKYKAMVNSFQDSSNLCLKSFENSTH